MKSTPFVTILALLTSAPAFAQAADSARPPHHKHHHIRHARRQAAIAPLTAAKPGPQPVSAENNAPVPNESVTAPPDRSGQETSVAPAVMQIHYPHLGDGYTEGSSAQAMDDRQAAKVTGVQVKVPLGQ